MHRSRLELACVLFMMTTVTLVSGCGGGHATHQALKDGWHAYGDAQTVDPVSVEVTDLEAWRGDEVMLEGWVGEVCAKKGCWMRMQDDLGDSVLVRFKDYGFFVPRNARGRRSVVHGSPVRQDALDRTTDVTSWRMPAPMRRSMAAIDAPSTEVDGLCRRRVDPRRSGLAAPYAPASRRRLHRG